MKSDTQKLTIVFKYILHSISQYSSWESIGFLKSLIIMATGEQGTDMSRATHCQVMAEIAYEVLGKRPPMIYTLSDAERVLNLIENWMIMYGKDTDDLRNLLRNIIQRLEADEIVMREDCDVVGDEGPVTKVLRIVKEDAFKYDTAEILPRLLDAVCFTLQGATPGKIDSVFHQCLKLILIEMDLPYSNSLTQDANTVHINFANGPGPGDELDIILNRMLAN